MIPDDMATCPLMAPLPMCWRLSSRFWTPSQRNSSGNRDLAEILGAKGVLVRSPNEKRAALLFYVVPGLEIEVHQSQRPDLRPQAWWLLSSGSDACVHGGRSVADDQ